MTSNNILLVEDDENLGFVLQETLELHGYKVTRATDGKAGEAAFHADTFDLCLMDVMMPEIDGFSLAKTIRETDKQIPIIFLTAKSMKEDRIEGFRIGGDDYVTKPFSMEELLLRIKAVLKRSLSSASPPIQGPRIFGKVHFNPEYQTLKINDAEKKLTHKESALLELLTRQPGTLLHRDEALKAIWGDDTFFTGRSMDVYISRLRKALKEDDSLKIVNIHGEGYKLIVQKD
ncbi:response regulator transcription factor [bacterium]|nr:response regulator transcription factor [bacterium]